VVLQRNAESLDARWFQSTTKSSAIRRVRGCVEIERRPAETTRVRGDDGFDGRYKSRGVERGGFDVGVAGEEVVPAVLGCVGERAGGAEEVVFGVDQGDVVAGDGGGGVDAFLGECL